MLHNTRRGGTAGQKLIARNFNATCIWATLQRGQAETHCPEFHRDLPSVAASARPDRKSLPGISSRPSIGA